MAVVKVQAKTGEIDGKPINWNVLEITSYIGGDFQTLSLKLSKTEALLANMLLNNVEDKPESTARRANTEEIESHSSKVKRNKAKTILEDDDEDDEGIFD